MDTRINQERKENFIAILYSTKTFQEDHFLTLIFLSNVSKICGIYFEKFGSLKLYDFHTFETREMFGAMNQNLFLSQTMMKA